MILWAYVSSIVLMIVLPLAAAIGFRRRYGAPLWLFCVGMATFGAAQLYHLPLNDWLGELGLIGPLEPDAPNLLRTAVVVGFSAAICETLARVVAFALLFRRRLAERWADGVMVGLGHGGFEALGFVAVLFAMQVTSLWALRGVDLATLGIPEAQMALVARQVAAFDQGLWPAFAPLVERALALLIHVVLSLLVWRALQRRNGLTVLLAVLYHALFDATAVYLGQFVTSIALIYAALGLLLLPGAVWLWRTPPAPPPAPLMAPLRAEWALFGAALRKELMQQWRTRRVLVVVAVFLIFGLGSPLIANFTPQIISSIEGAEQFAHLIPPPTRADALYQYIRNLTQFGLIMAVLLGMGAVAGEKERGTAPLILSKPLPRWAFVLSKFVAQALVYLLGFGLALLGAAYYTSLLFTPLAFGPFVLGNLLLLVWLLTYAAITLLASTLTRSTGAAAGGALLGAVLLLLAGAFPRLGQLAPGALVAWAGQLGLETAVTANGGALVASVALIVVCLVTAVAVFEVQEV